MGFDLNRHWLDPSPWAHPTLHGVKQLIVQMYNDPVSNRVPSVADDSYNLVWERKILHWEVHRVIRIKNTCSKQGRTGSLLIELHRPKKYFLPILSL